MVSGSGLPLPRDSGRPTEAAGLFGKPTPPPSLPGQPQGWFLACSPRGPELGFCYAPDRLGLQQTPPQGAREQESLIRKRRAIRKG